MDSARTSGDLREHNRVRLLRAVHDCGATRTRSQLTRDLALTRGTASVLVAGLGADELLGEAPATAHTRGRPTQVPGPHPHGPVALAVDLREDSWELAVCELGGRAAVVENQPHDGTPDGALLPLAAAVRERLERLGPRVVGVGMSVAGPVRDGTLLDIAHLGWRDIDVAARMNLPGRQAQGGSGPGISTPQAGDASQAEARPRTGRTRAPETTRRAAVPGDTGSRRSTGQAPAAVPLHIGNDARLAGLAEARRGGLQGVRVGLHLHIAFDLGGALLVDGKLLHGDSGTTGEFGHLPLTGNQEPCRCGATGCWGLDVGGNALLRHMGLAAGGGRGWDAAERILAEAGRAAATRDAATEAAATDAAGPDAASPDAASPDAAGTGHATATTAVTANARALGTGIGALINGLDPEAVTLSGLGVELHALARDTLHAACTDSLMAFRRDRPRPVRIAASSLGRHGPLTGAMESVFDAFLSPEGLAAWRTARDAGTVRLAPEAPGAPEAADVPQRTDTPPGASAASGRVRPA
ncbi:ROK family protein [Streptomyces sp. N2-109]|uniref:ROK family protein n=1 Tax=Streptomyces gossypii TaxID=2883101 RepID=A0ABT2JPQ6_9ACTN|nr:ROK family protein [Streptomyces gossypii]MCT2589857.1 ROK family protein [Streptomyces gossypii]